MWRAALPTLTNGFSQANFPKEVLETKHQQVPIVVCFYSPRNPRTFNYLDAFQRSVETFHEAQAFLKFGLVNLVDEPTGVWF